MQCLGSSGGWWVTYFADPSKVCPPHQHPLLRGLNLFHITGCSPSCRWSCEDPVTTLVVFLPCPTYSNSVAISTGTGNDDLADLGLMDNSFLAFYMPPPWSYDVSLPAVIRQCSPSKTEFYIPFFDDFFSCLTHSRECGCSIRLNLLAWQDDMWDHPYACEKRLCGPSVFEWSHHEKLFQCVSNFSTWSKCRVSCSFVRWCFNFFFWRRAVRIYVNACQNRLQWTCGIPFLRLFVLVGLA